MPNKIASERTQRMLMELATKPGNDICADCKSRNPRWASYSLGIFLCVNCASIHRKMGTHISKVKSLTMDSWTKEQVDVMRENGNVKSNRYYNADETRHPPPPNLMDGERDSEMEQYIRSKYQYRRFVDKHAIVASKLGPSRSAASLPPRSSNPPTPTSATFPRSVPVTSQSTSKAPPLPHSALPSVVSQSHMQPQHQPVAKPGVWDDLVSLQSPSASSSLPLQMLPAGIQPTMTGVPSAMNAMNPFANMTVTSPAIPTMSSGMSFNAYQSIGPATNPFAQQQQLMNGASGFVHPQPQLPVPQRQGLFPNTPSPQIQLTPSPQSQVAPSPHIQLAPLPQIQMTPSPQIHGAPQLTPGMNGGLSASQTPGVMSAPAMMSTFPGSTAFSGSYMASHNTGFMPSTNPFGAPAFSTVQSSPAFNNSVFPNQQSAPATFGGAFRGPTPANAAANPFTSWIQTPPTSGRM
ncbi:ArfGap-domain-containing protein [Fistulina hepatica ATCC 64428]|uniref:ArfGap-domain-containing protein n=1 Tax=Fistulina hepatica ATCC 64428 TaxID=1128425 RepID=A0A0D7AER7_9AGAR|nr:ArfGap-domain-containing protein [Fistulina hepatica ATCC 64428]